MGEIARLRRLLREVARGISDGEPAPRALLPGARAPIVLLHGFGTSSRVLLPLERRLARELGRPVLRVALGGPRIPLHLGDVRASAARVQREIERLACEAGAESVDVVGHSLGGLVATYLLKRLDRGRRVRRVITLATPHRGTPLALLGALLLGPFSRAIWQMIPGSGLLRELAALPVPSGSRLVALASDGDSVVPAGFARVVAAPGQTNAALPRLGHLDFLSSPAVFALVGGLLARA
jgi:pimeloyl-ACP methyl ester carboxylesterase